MTMKINNANRNSKNTSHRLVYVERGKTPEQDILKAKVRFGRNPTDPVIEIVIKGRTAQRLQKDPAIIDMISNPGPLNIRDLDVNIEKNTDGTMRFTRFRPIPNDRDNRISRLRACGTAYSRLAR